MTPAGSPLDVLRDHEHQATTGVEGTAYCARCEAVADVKELVEAAREVAARLDSEDDPSWDSPSELDALASALARFDRNQQA